MASLHALPMYLGLDLRGGVHFLLQVDLKAALDKKTDDAGHRHPHAAAREAAAHRRSTRDGNAVDVIFHDAAAAAAGRQRADRRLPRRAVDVRRPTAPTSRSPARSSRPRSSRRRTQAIKQNMTTLGNRVAGLGTSEPVIQQQGPDRIVVELPGIQDTAKARELIGRTATLEIHMVDESAEAQRRGRGHRRRCRSATTATPNSPDVAGRNGSRRSSRRTSSPAATTWPTPSPTSTARPAAPSST